MPRGDNNQVSRFKPGVSPNPGGRPKLDPDSKELLRKNSAQAIRLMHGLKTTVSMVGVPATIKAHWL